MKLVIANNFSNLVSQLNVYGKDTGETGDTGRCGEI